MKTHTENVPIEIPDGYTCTGYRVPKKGDLCVNSETREIFVPRHDSYKFSKLILKKVHTPPVPCYCLQTSGVWAPVTHCASWTYKHLNGVGPYYHDGSPYDLMICTTSATQCVMLGHWNDGILEEKDNA